MRTNSVMISLYDLGFFNFEIELNTVITGQ